MPGRPTRAHSTSEPSRKAGFTRNASPPAFPIWSSARSFPSLPAPSPPPRPRPRCRRCARPPWSSSIASCLSSMPRTATFCLSAIRATMTTRYARRCAAMSGGAKTVMMSSPQALPDTGQPSTIFAGPSIKATPPSACHPTTAGFSTGNAYRCSPTFGSVMTLWPRPLMRFHSNKPKMAAATSTTAILAFSNLARSMSACSNRRSSARAARSPFARMFSRGKDRAATTHPTIWSP